MQRYFKIISFVMIALIILTLSPSAFADSDNDRDSAQPTETLGSIESQAVERTYALQILSQSDLAKDSNENITRAEFCVWVVKMVGLEGGKFGNFRFSDVPDDYWASDYINTACSLKLISESDKFNPDSPIRYDEALKMLSVAAGYEPAAAYYGGWPSGYVTVASRYGISKGASPNGEYISRANAAVLVDNTLDVKILDTTNSTTYKQGDGTVLSEYLNIDIYRGRIIEIDTKEKKIKVEINNSELWYDLAENVDIAFIVEDEADLYVLDKRSEKKIVYIDFKGSLTVSYDYICEVNESEANIAYTSEEVKKIYLLNEDKEYNVNSDAIITLNDVDAKLAPAAINGTFAKVVKDDGRVCKIQAYSLYEGGIIYRADPTMLKYIHGDVNDNVMQGLDKIDDLQIYIDGVPHTDMYDLKSDMVFDYYISSDDEKLIIVASSRNFDKNLDLLSSDSLTLDGVEYDISKAYGLYVYSNIKERYQKDTSLNTYLGKKVHVFADDTGCVRYIKISEEIESTDTFLGVVMAVSTGSNIFDDDEAQIKIFKITGGQGEKVYETDAKKMKKSTIKMDYIRANAANTEGGGFLKFTTNKENKITKVEPVEMWGSKMTFSGTISRTSEKWIKNLYTAQAIMFAAFFDDGKFKVITIDWDKNMRDVTFESDVTIISDYDPLYNPKPDYIMLGTGSESHRSSGEDSGCVQEINEIADDMVEIIFNNTWGNRKYTISKDYFNTLGLKENMMAELYTDLFTDKQIMVKAKHDTSIDPELWEDDNAKFNSGTCEGFFKADSIMYRDKNVAQFMVNGEVTDLYPLYSYCCVYEIVRGKNGIQLGRQRGSTPVGYISEGDKVWFHLIPWGPEPRSVDYIIYEKTGIAGN